jgi:AcrR family transcriptional regulator
MVRLRRPEQVQRNQEALLDAARRVFLEKGYAGASLEAIAAEAGFSKGVVYSQFGSKADMFMALLERRIAERRKQNERVAAELSGTEGLRQLLLLGARDAAADTGWSQLLVEFRALAARDAVLNQRYAEAHARTVEGVASVLGGIHERAGREPIAPLPCLAEFVLALGSGITLEKLANVDSLPHDEVSVMVLRAFGFDDPATSQGD